MIEYEVYIAAQAENDLDAIFDYIAGCDGLEQAVLVQERLMDEILSLATLPGRGKFPPEMDHVGVAEFREIQCTPWRIFYIVTEATTRVGVLAVLDGRRHVAHLLEGRRGK